MLSGVPLVSQRGQHALELGIAVVRSQRYEGYRSILRMVSEVIGRVTSARKSGCTWSSKARTASMKKRSPRGKISDS
ncbi:MAG: hypothetical protein JWN48_363 [Myxococcaceae bacterium]|nr:hypothetical protein [Myxococcaceae bacterium]